VDEILKWVEKDAANSTEAESNVGRDYQRYTIEYLD
jgi:hypothetical protein